MANREGDRILRLGGPKKISQARHFPPANFFISSPLEFALLCLEILPSNLVSF